MLFVCYPKCSTCKKAEKWLNEHNLQYSERHIAEDNPSYDELKEWHKKSGLPLKRFFNTSGVLYKEMELKNKLPTMSEDEQLKLLATNGMLVKRPIIISDDKVFVGFKVNEWENLLYNQKKEGSGMIYVEKEISYADYVRLRESVNWNNFFKGQTEKCLKNTLYSVAAIDNNTVIGMGRLIGDGMYYMIVDVIVQPDYQGKGIGSNIVNRLTEYVQKETPAGGRSSIQLTAEKGKEGFYEKLGFKLIPNEFCGSSMRKVIRR